MRVEPPVMGLVPYEKRHQRARQPPLHHVRREEGGRCLQARRRVLTSCQICERLDLGLPSFHN